MRLRICILMLLLVGGVGRGQPTQPAAPGTAPPQSWTQTVQSLADALAHVGEGDVLRDVLPAGTPIRRFHRMEPEDRLSLREFTSESAVILALGYETGTTTIASDFSREMQSANFAPQWIRDQFTLSDNPREIKRANETASQWVMSALQPGVEQPVGIIMLWRERPSEVAGGASRTQIIFVLVKGQRALPEQYRITHVVYGDTSQILR